jgi:hypothetical protein
VYDARDCGSRLPSADRPESPISRSQARPVDHPTSTGRSVRLA